MAKRSLENEASDRPRKAPRKFAAEDAEPPAKIYSITDLRQQLRFTQDDPERLRKGQFAFKDFLKSISDPVQDADRGYRLEILREYLDSEPDDMLKTWTFAGQVDNERLVFAVATTFAQLLKTLSTLLDFKDHGLAVAKSLLQREQLKLLQRGLTSESHKQTIINACLQIVTEITAFDGGSIANLVYGKQDFVFSSKFLDRNLRLFVASSGGDRRETSVRAETIRYILTHLRHQDIDTRCKIIDMRSVFRNLLDNLKSDPPHLIVEVLKTLEMTVLKQQGIPRRLKSAIISDRVLAAVIDHLRNAAAKQTDDAPTGDFDAIWALLRNVCTDPDLGVALPCSWYPSPKARGEDDLFERSVFEGPDLKSIRNPILSKFAQHLKPHTSEPERELLMSIFKVAPELVADYLRQARQRLNMLPKLTNTWIGYASLIYSIVDLPIPTYLGSSDGYRSDPPPQDNVLENMLPSPLTKDVLTKCLNQPSPMICFFASRIMVVALRKLQNLVGIYETAAREHDSWTKATFEIVNAVLGRLPAIKDVFLVYKNMPETEYMGREAAAHLLCLYQKLLPTAAPEDMIDVAAPLAAVINSLQDSELDADNRAMVELQLTHLLRITEDAQGMSWWQRPAALQYSAFLTITKLCVDHGSFTAADSLVHTLETAAFEDGVLQGTTQLSAVNALFASLESDKSWKALPETWTFLDNCISRLTKSPIKYLDDLDALEEDPSSTRTISLLLLVILEQIPFTSRLEAEPRENILTWASRFITALASINEDKTVIRKIKDNLKSAGFKLPKTKVRAIRGPAQSPVSAAVDPVPTSTKRSGLAIDFPLLPVETDKHPELIRYKTLDLDDLVHNGTLASLLLKPCSPFPEIRLQSIPALSEIVDYIHASTAEYKDQLWLLVGEVVETCSSSVAQRPLSYLAGSFATHALKVLLDPGHFMFPAVNRYLLKDPYWNVRKLPGYFLERALLEAPDEEDKYGLVLEWVLTMLVDGVRREHDAKLLRSSGAVERVLGVLAAPVVAPGVALAVFKLVHRIVMVEGSTALVMDAGLVSWLDVVGRDARFAGDGVEELKRLVEEKMDQERVREWRAVKEKVVQNGA